MIHRVLGLLSKKNLINRRRGKRTTIAFSKPTVLVLFFASAAGSQNSGYKNDSVMEIARKIRTIQLPIPALLYAGIQKYAIENGLNLILQPGDFFIQNSGYLPKQIDGIILFGERIDEVIDQYLKSSNIPRCIIGPHYLFEGDFVSAQTDTILGFMQIRCEKNLIYGIDKESTNNDFIASFMKLLLHNLSQ